jgi:hypothetical protein
MRGRLLSSGPARLPALACARLSFIRSAARAAIWSFRCRPGQRAKPWIVRNPGRLRSRRSLSCCRAGGAWGLSGGGLRGPRQGERSAELDCRNFDRHRQFGAHRRQSARQARRAVAEVLGGGQHFAARRLRHPYTRSLDLKDEATHSFINQIHALGIAMLGAPSFFTPRFPPLHLWPPQKPQTPSFYDVSPLKATLERLVDFDRINNGEMRLGVGAVNVSSGNFMYFDTTTHKIDARHILASGSAAADDGRGPSQDGLC